MPFTKQCFSTEKVSLEKQMRRGLFLITFWKGLSRISHSSFSQLNWMTPLISSEICWIAKRSSFFLTEWWMPKGRNGELGLAGPSQLRMHFWLQLYLHHTWTTHLSITSLPCLYVARVRSSRFVVWASLLYGKAKHSILWLCFSVEIVWQTSRQGQQRCLCLVTILYL